MVIRFTTIASHELKDAAAWYHARNPNSAEKLLLRVQDAKMAITLFPLAAPPIGKRARRLVVTGFPYDLVYTISGEEIVIIAFAHHSRQPRYWRDRLSTTGTQ